MQDIKDFFKQSLSKEIVEELCLPINLNNIDEFITPFIVYLRELKKWNKAYNLTAIEEEREIVIKHFIDSLLYLYFIKDKSLTIADVGSGAGFPGIPIAILMPYLKIKLIEPSWKKCAFLKNIKRKLELKNVEIIEAKAEDVSEKFDIVLSRALWSIRDFIKKCSHLLKEGGFFLISKSLKIAEELKDLPSEVKIEIKEFTLPEVLNFSKESKRFIIKIEDARFRY